jgi:SAM-dependent methyltransferase
VSSAWFETFFQGPAIEFWARVTTPALTKADADFLEKALEAKPGARLLDVACGHGRHAIELVRRGYRLTGVDISNGCLAMARRSAEEAGLDADWRRGDMRALELEPDAFDGAYCFGNAFGYLSPPEAGGFLAGLAAALRPGGRLVIEHGTCAESILPSLVSKRWMRAGDILFLSEMRYAAEASRMDIDYTFIQGHSSVTHQTSAYVTTAAELRRLLDDAGLDVIGIAGGVAGEPFQIGSRLVLTARKRDNPSAERRGTEG